jgi:hypothetical protein
VDQLIRWCCIDRLSWHDSAGTIVDWKTQARLPGMIGQHKRIYEE